MLLLLGPCASWGHSVIVIVSEHAFARGWPSELARFLFHLVKWVGAGVLGGVALYNNIQVALRFALQWHSAVTRPVLGPDRRAAPIAKRLAVSTHRTLMPRPDHRMAFIGLRVRVERRTGWGFAGENKLAIMARGPLGVASSIVGSGTCSSYWQVVVVRVSEAPRSNFGYGRR